MFKDVFRVFYVVSLVCQGSCLLRIFQDTLVSQRCFKVVPKFVKGALSAELRKAESAWSRLPDYPMI